MVIVYLIFGIGAIICFVSFVFLMLAIKRKDDDKVFMWLMGVMTGNILVQLMNCIRHFVE